jgi:hypothetical protein
VRQRTIRENDRGTKDVVERLRFREPSNRDLRKVQALVQSCITISLSSLVAPVNEVVSSRLR